MSNIQRYIPIQAIQTKDKKIIPIWDERIVFEKTELYGNIIYLKDDIYQKHHMVIECIYDLKTKCIEIGIEVNYYPVETEFKVSEAVMYETSYSSRKLKKAEIVEIVYEKFDMYIKRGKSVDNWYKNNIKDIVFEPELLYNIKDWKPIYILNDGTKIETNYSLYRLV